MRPVTHTADVAVKSDATSGSRAPVADAQGIGSLTIRSLAQELGAKPMSLYHYVRNKDEIFDGIVVSAAVKLLKPEPAIYEHLRERFELNFAESVFIDDLERNVDSARRVGLQAIQFTSTDQVRRELAALL